jgi:hypothetical protein
MFNLTFEQINLAKNMVSYFKKALAERKEKAPMLSYYEVERNSAEYQALAFLTTAFPHIFIRHDIIFDSQIKEFEKLVGILLTP